MYIAAKFGGTCPLCGTSTKVGDLVRWAAARKGVARRFNGSHRKCWMDYMERERDDSGPRPIPEEQCFGHSKNFDQKTTGIASKSSVVSPAARFFRDYKAAYNEFCKRVFLSSPVRVYNASGELVKVIGRPPRTKPK